MAEITLYGLAACDTCRRARRWLDLAGVDAHWHDVRADGLPPEISTRLADAAGWAQLINRRSRTWRTFDEADREMALERPAALLAEHPVLLKRPVLEAHGEIVVGFDPEAWAAALETGQ